MKQFLDTLTIIAIVSIIVFSCVTPMRSGYYTVKAINGATTIQLKEVQGDWHVPNADTLKVGQRIYLNRTKDLAKINVW